MITVRYFAAAAEAAGLDTQRVSAVTAGTAAALVDRLVAEHGPGLARVLAQCSLLSGGRRLMPEDELADDALVDVLPPFAGG